MIENLLCIEDQWTMIGKNIKDQKRNNSINVYDVKYIANQKSAYEN